MLGWMVEEKGIDPHVLVWQRPPRNDDTFPNSDFDWIGPNKYRCPAGHALRKERWQFKEPRSHITKAGTVIYRFQSVGLRLVLNEGSIRPEHTAAKNPTQCS
ncbi:hypothetical protein LMG28138_05259 [Pararobbsia alpina]|uniref:Uncharacterized protein n=2 Tax=Pararobbsia alpina TaxID=621374 RepID=A0A6S7BY97_9BURK|nr:hypothetical protein LMG28138_05259 [Pararobbsia alpina]